MTTSHNKKRNEVVQKIPWRKSLLWKITRVIILISSVGAVLHFAVYRTLDPKFEDLIEQSIYWGVAQEIEFDLRPLLSPELKHKEIYEVLFRFQRYNPKMDVYLLNEKGRIVLSTYPFEGKFVPLEPLREFISSKGVSNTPLYGPDPSRRSQSERSTPISAAKTEILGKAGYVYVALRGSHYWRVYHNLGDFILSLASFSFLIVVAVFVVVSCAVILYFFTRPFAMLSNAIQRFAGGDYAVRIASPGDDEIGLHAQSFNDMAETIESNVRALEEADEFRRQLLANVSHDLRTPLSAMKLLLQILREKYSTLTQEEQQNFIDRVLINCEDLNSLIDDLFELSKLDSKLEEPDLVSISVKRLLLSQVKKFAVAAEKKDLGIVLDVPKEEFLVVADEKMITRALANLIENAIRYSVSGGEVRVSAYDGGDGRALISISDSGIGISENELEDVFERFYRGTRASEMESSGTGLGLAITKKIIELHGETIRAKSKLGEGSEFSFHLSISDNIIKPSK